MRLLRYFFAVIMMIVGVLFLMVLRDIITPPRHVETSLEPAFVIHPEETIDEIRARRAAEEDVNSPWHREQFETEVAFNLGIDTSEVTEEQFNERYSNPQN